MKFKQVFAFTSVLLLCLNGAGSYPAAAPPAGGQMVVLLHGLGRTAKSMASMQKRLTETGYTVFNYDYESRKNAINSLVDDLQDFLADCCLQSDIKLNFVTHSLGGILVRALIAEKRPGNLGRVVMLSPPNKGSDVVDFFREYPLFEYFFGQAAAELGTGRDSFPNRLGPADFEVGIITGNRTIDPISSWIIGGADDGKVSIAQAKLEGMADFMVVEVSHAFIMQNKDVIDEVIYFLQNGRFSKPADALNNQK